MLAGSRTCTLALVAVVVVACASPSPGPAHPGPTTSPTSAHPAPPLEIPANGAPMPEFAVTRWVNSPPLTPASLRGKVVLVDFWEYTCVNCLRTLPFVKAWWARYRDAGLVVVGVHAPEFDLGREAKNIDRGVREFGLEYPVALDDELATWERYHNRAWPAKYLFDAEGRLRGSWMGEGDYPEIEAAIRQLLLEANPRATLPDATAEVAHYADDFAARAGISRETYLGTQRRRGDAVTLGGAWADAKEYVEHKGAEPATIEMTVVAGEVNLVMDPGPTGKAEVVVKLDGHRVGADTRGADVGDDGVARFDRAGMIRLVKGAAKEEHALRLETKTPGLRAYAFTFGP